MELDGCRDKSRYWKFTFQYMDSLLVLALVVAFFMMPFDRGSSAHILYGCVIVCMVSMLLHAIQSHRRFLNCLFNSTLPLAFAMLVLSAVEFWWLRWYGASGAMGWMNAIAQKVSGFWLSGAVLVLYFGAFYTDTLRVVKQLIIVLILIAVTAIVYVGIKQYIYTDDRIALKLGYPVPAGFVFANILLVAELATQYSLSLRNRAIYLTIICIGTAVLVTMTGTRDAFVILCILSVAVICSFRHHMPYRATNIWWYMFFSAIFIAVLGVAFSSRFDQLLEDLGKYWNGVPSGSMGGRFVIWQAGIHSFLENPWGYTGQYRYEVIYRYIDHMLSNHQQLVPIIIDAAKHHMHNELIEALSLEGVLGGGAVIFFYLSFLYSVRSSSVMSPMARWLLLSIVVFGLVEPVLNSDKTVLCLVLIIPLCIVYKPNSVESHNMNSLH